MLIQTLLWDSTKNIILTACLAITRAEDVLPVPKIMSEMVSVGTQQPESASNQASGA
jgi:hypothetical protein